MLSNQARGQRAAVASAAARHMVLCAVALAITATSFFATPLPKAAAEGGVDDYPVELKTPAQDSLADQWLFYNRECTSFVAWRLNHDAGLAFNNSYFGEHWGNASNWAYAADQVGVTVDDNPTEGAVAWWSAGSAGSSSGHVAWVRSASATEITIEEYNYLSRGGYDTRTISSTSSTWPSAFIHLGDLPMWNTARPVVKGEGRVGKRLVTGEAFVGDALTAASGIWSVTPDSIRYQWQRNGVPIRGATGAAYTPTAADGGHRVSVKVTVRADGHTSASATSAPVVVRFGVATFARRPHIRGQAMIGIVQTAAAAVSPGRGHLSPNRAQFTYRWFRGDHAIRRANQATYQVTGRDVGSRLRVRVRINAPNWVSSTSWSARTAAVVPRTG
ncbi:MAG TPA: CHAP domain-containing protein [Nocardioidaceae bacterium]